MNSWRTLVSGARVGIILFALMAGGGAWLGLGAQDKPAQDPAPPAAPAAPSNGIVTSGGVAYRFAYAGNVAQIPLENVSGRMLMPVRVNAGKPGFFLVATGGPRTALDPKPWLPQDAADASTIDFKKTLFSLPGLDMQVAELMPVSLVDYSDQVGQPVRGILGADVLRQFVIEIEYDRSAIHFYDANSFEYSGKGMKLPLIMRGGLPSIHMKVSLEGRGSFEDDFAVETETASTVSVSKPYAVAHHINEKKLKGFWRVNPNGEKTLLTRVKSIAIGPYVFEEPIVEFPPAAGPDNSSGSIGNGLLSRFRIFLDQPHQQVILETGENYKSNFEADMSGVVLVAKGANLKTFEVAAVTPHSPGSEAGLQKGDVIAGIDGQPAADLDLSGVRDMFRVFGHEYHLTVVRNEHTVEMKMKTKRLV
jgi:PDZ domain-containing protein